MEGNDMEESTTLDVSSFFFSDPISEEVYEAVAPSIIQAFERVIAECEQGGPNILESFRQEQLALREKRALRQAVLSEQAIQDATVDSDARDYQSAILEIAKERNTIVHLATGTGKTLVAILLIKHFAPDFQGKNQHTVFLVPNVALALQQTMCIRANTSYTVGTASSRTVRTPESRNELARCNVLVATHGAFLDLLSSYQDVFRMENVNLLILDECHNAVGNSAYTTIMQNFYHNAMSKPRVLGLTASPLINCKKNPTASDLREQLESLESILDARIVTMRELGMDENSLLLQKEAEETTIQYEKASVELPSSFLDMSHLDLLKSRKKELDQLVVLYMDLGPYITSVYSSFLRTDLKPNTFENESSEQFKNAVDFLDQVATFCQEFCKKDSVKSGRTDKLLALEELLDQQIEERPDAVGLVFVQRRITAIALNEYFQRRQNAARNKEEWPSASRVRHPQEAAAPQEQNRIYNEEVERGGEVPDHVSVAHTMVSTITVFTADLDDRFMDADSDDDPFYPNIVPEAQQLHANDPAPDPLQEDLDYDQFGDADSCDDPSRALNHMVSAGSIVPVEHNRSVHWEASTELGTGVVSQMRAVTVDCEEDTQQTTPSNATQPATNAGKSTASFQHTIRCRALVRKPTSLFKVLQGRSEIQKEVLQTELDKELNHEANVREVLNGLRRGEINVLVATSIVEEGVDVKACSFVAAFDPITSLKSYVQMKGRARQKEAKFFAFDDAGRETPHTDLTTLQNNEQTIRDYLSSRPISSLPFHVEPVNPASMSDNSFEVSTSYSLSPEHEAAQRGSYQGPLGTAHLQTAKSLLNRFVLAQPMDPAVESSKAAQHAHLPTYDSSSTKLYLPAHIAEPSLRVVELPEQYSQRRRKDKQNILALMACVRLHKCGLLTDRLLPLCLDSIESKFIALTNEETQDNFFVDEQGTSTTGMPCRTSCAYVYRILQESEMHLNFLERLGGSNLHLAIVACAPLNEVPPPFKQQHPEFGDVWFSLAPPVQSECTAEQLGTLSDFFLLVFNARWRRRTRTATFKFHPSNAIFSPGCPCYRVGCVNAEGALLWDYMKLKLDESKRSQEERVQAVRGLSDAQRLPAPRLWSPEYDEKAMYIVYGPAGERADARFPHDTGHEQVQTYQNYYWLKHGYHVPVDSQLFLARHLWHLPSRRSSRKHPKELLQRECIRLSKDACFEPLVADAALYHICTFLPQILYHVERSLCAQQFIVHCSTHLPTLGRLLKGLPLTDVVGVLSAKRCEESSNFERLEWLGDAVLKLVQTEVILKSTKLRAWVRNMHEGNLNAIRSILGSNKRLSASCKSLGVDRFVLTAPLARGKWAPSPMELSPASSEPSIGSKVYADVVEALIGLAYSRGNYQAAMVVATELQATIPYEATFVEISNRREEPQSNPELLNLVESFTNYSFSSQELVLEAFTHPTARNPDTPSYQRLEWFGDAVLCLAARCWIFRKFPSSDVRTLVLTESALVSNETLAYLSLKSGLHRHLIHNDTTMPGRIESYAWAVEELGRRLWGTAPPKAIADIVEAVLGAVHIDGGFSHGQQAAQKVLEPVMNILERTSEKDLWQFLQHPKRSLLEIGGKLTSLSTLEESEYAKERRVATVWLGNEWGKVYREGHRSVASIQCLDENLMSLVDDSPPLALNRACEFVLAVLGKNPQLQKSFQAARAKVIRPEESDGEDSS